MTIQRIRRLVFAGHLSLLWVVSPAVTTQAAPTWQDAGIGPQQIEADWLHADSLREKPGAKGAAAAPNPNVTPEDRKRLESNIAVFRMANNRRVDVTLSTTGQSSQRFAMNSSKRPISRLSHLSSMAFNMPHGA